MIKVVSEIPIYELQGKEMSHVYSETSPKLIIQSHWNHTERIHLKIKDENNNTIDIVVLADDLIAATVNAQKTGKRW